MKVTVIMPILECPDLVKRNLAECQAVAAPGTTVEVVSLSSGPPSIECAKDVAKATPGILEAVQQAAANGTDACMISCFMDPAIDAAREISEIPVIAAGETSMHFASLLGTRFSIVTMLPEIVPRLWSRARAYGLANNLMSIRDIGIPVLDLAGDKDRIVAAFIEATRQAVVEDGANAICLGCTGTAGLAASVQTKLGDEQIHVPVIDPVHVMLKLAESLVSIRQSFSRRAFPQLAR